MVITENNSTFVLSPSQKVNEANKLDDNLVSKIEELTKLRKSISLDLKSIAVATKISTHQLKNIEGLKFDRLPPRPMRESCLDQYCAEIRKAHKLI